MEDQAVREEDVISTDAPEEYVPPAADVTETMPPQCSF
jgi:hypothetical protein